MLQTFPLLAVSLALYFFISIATRSWEHPWYEVEALHFKLMSGDTWQISGGHLFIVFSLAMLFIEILRATRSGGASTIINHALSVVVFVASFLLFFTTRGYGNSTFFIYTMMSLLDFMAGFIITTVTARRDFAVGRLDE